jgi:hypothetical protein
LKITTLAGKAVASGGFGTTKLTFKAPATKLLAVIEPEMEAGEGSYTVSLRRQ